MTIFVAGIHGVGKTHLCKEYVVGRTVTHATASTLIREHLKTANWTNEKLVSDVDRNQMALIEAVKQRRTMGEQLLLDGHFALKGTAGEFILIETQVFAELKISGVILLEADAAIVRERLKDRDKNTNFGDIEEFSQAEHQHAVSTCEKLGIPLTVLRSPTHEAFAEAINNYLTM